MKWALTKTLVIASALALALAACGGGDDSSSAGGSPSTTGGTDYASLSGSIKGSGSSFQDAFDQAVIDAFADVAPNASITYNSVGSGTGKSEFGQGLTDFGGTDSLVKEGDGPAAGSFLYVPTVAAPITVSYNLPSIDKLQLSADTIAGIFQRDITNWNDPKIAADNPGITLPDTNITVVHRSDGSGTTSNFTKYLDAAADGWTLGSGDTVAWPADTQAGPQNTGVARLVQQTEGGIGYVDFSDATASQLVFAAIKNKDGNYVEPSLDASTSAVEGAQIKSDLSYNPLNPPGPDAYPITSPTYILVRTSYDDASTAELVKGFLTYMLTDGQALASGVDYAALPDSLAQQALAQVDKIQPAS